MRKSEIDERVLLMLEQHIIKHQHYYEQNIILLSKSKNLDDEQLKDFNFIKKTLRKYKISTLNE